MRLTILTALLGLLLFLLLLPFVLLLGTGIYLRFRRWSHEGESDPGAPSARERD
jgi:hypothetical protein